MNPKKRGGEEASCVCARLLTHSCEKGINWVIHYFTILRSYFYAYPPLTHTASQAKRVEFFFFSMYLFNDLINCCRSVGKGEKARQRKKFSFVEEERRKTKFLPFQSPAKILADNRTLKPGEENFAVAGGKERAYRVICQNSHANIQRDLDYFLKKCL